MRGFVNKKKQRKSKRKRKQERKKKQKQNSFSFLTFFAEFFLGKLTFRCFLSLF